MKMEMKIMYRKFGILALKIKKLQDYKTSE